MAFYQDRDAAVAATDKLRVFAQPQRLMILYCLLRGERNVGEIDDATGIGQPALSQQLAALRRADLVRTRKEAQLVWYALADASVATCVRYMESIFGGSGDLPETDDAPDAIADRAVNPGTAGFARLS